MLKSSWRWAVLAAGLVACGGQPSKASLTGTSSGSTGHTSTGSGGAGAGSTTAHITNSSGTPGSSSSSNGATGTTAGNTTGTDGETSAGNNTTGSASAAGSTNGNLSATTGATTTATTGANTTTGTTAAASTTTGGATSSGSGACYPDGSFVGLGNDSLCCSGTTDNTDYCSEPGQGTLTSTGGTTGGTTATTEGTTTGDSSGTTAGTTAGNTGGTTGATCPVSCYSARGYHCENGQCVLNGQDGDVQVTLQWDTSLQTNGERAREDLDLHVVDPSGCEMYYGSKICGNGSLDLDQNAGCGMTDNQGGFGNDTENVIYAADGGAPAGTFTVIVDDWSDSCGGGYPDGGGSAPSPFTWKLTIRSHGSSTVYMGQFHLGDNDHSGGLKGASDATGHKVFTFTN